MDALRDLDDPLTMVHLFATLPAEQLHGIPAKAVQACTAPLSIFLFFRSWPRLNASLLSSP